MSQRSNRGAVFSQPFRSKFSLWWLSLLKDYDKIFKTYELNYMSTGVALDLRGFVTI